MSKKIIIFLLLSILIFSCDKEVFTGIVDTFELEEGKILVNSNPPGFKIFIDNKNMGVITPDTVDWLKYGTHKLTLKNDWNLYDTTLTVEINKGVINQVNINLLNNPRFYGKINCSTYPSDAKIFINGVDTGFKTPKLISNLIPGYYNIMFRKNLCRDDSTIVKVKGGQSLNIYYRLEDTTRSVSYRTSNSKIFSNYLKRVVIDKNNNKWIGSLNVGLMKYDGKNWTEYNNNGKLSDANITDLLFDKQGRLWIATTTGLTLYDGISWSILNSNLPSIIVNALEEDIHGNIWIATDNGLVKYDNNNFQTFNISNSPLPENRIQCVTSFKDGKIGIGTSGSGVVIKNGNSWENYNIYNYFGEDHIANLAIDMIEYNNALWVFMLGDPNEGTRNGLIKFENGTWKEFILPLQFPVEVVSFSVDNNIMWLACKEGLVKYNPFGQTKLFNTEDFSFYVKHCTSASVDKNGDVWATTLGGGIVKIKKNNY